MGKLDQISVNGTSYEIVPEIAPLFSASTAYAIGDCVIKDAVLYRFTAAHPAGAWIGTDAEEVTVASELSVLKADLEELSGATSVDISVVGKTLVINTNLVNGNEVNY